MDVLEACARARGAVVDLPARFMMDAATYERGGALGYDGVDFYFAGRGGALGDVDGAVVAAAFVFFNPDTVCAAWDRARRVGAPREAAAAFAACAEAWAGAHLPEGVDYARLAELAGRVIAAASPAGAPLFAAWRAMPEPTSPPARSLHLLNVLRELRGGLHGAAVLAAGMTPELAVGVRTPFMAALFGWPEPSAPSDDERAAWDGAEQATNRALARSFAVLGEAELSELVELGAAAAASPSP